MQIRNIQYLRAVAAITVVLCHIHLWQVKTYGFSGLVPSWFSIGDAGVDLFFVISGFIMVFIQPTPIDSRSSYLRFMAHRATRIYPPLWLILLPLTPVFLVAPKLFNNFYGNRVDLLRSFLLLPQDYTPLLLAAWTLIHEVYFYVMVSFALLFAQRGRWIFGFAWLSLCLFTFLLFGQTRFGDIRLLQLMFSPFSLTFLMGYFIALSRERIRRCPRPILLALMGGGVLGLMAGFHWISDLGVYPNNNYLGRCVFFGLPCALIVASAIGLEDPNSKGGFGFKRLGDASYAMYLTHLPVISVVYVVAKLAHIQRPEVLGVVAVICFILCLISALAFHAYLELPLIRFFRNLIGKKIK